MANSSRATEIKSAMAKLQAEGKEIGRMAKQQKQKVDEISSFKEPVDLLRRKLYVTQQKLDKVHIKLMKMQQSGEKLSYPGREANDMYIDELIEIQDKTIDEINKLIRESPVDIDTLDTEKDKMAELKSKLINISQRFTSLRSELNSISPSGGATRKYKSKYSTRRSKSLKRR